jgi:hypothetical protein
VGTDELHYTVTERDYADGMTAMLESFDFGRRAVLVWRLLGSFTAVVALLWWFLFALDSQARSAAVALAFSVAALFAVFWAKSIVKGSYRRRLAKMAKRDSLVPAGPYRASITVDGLQEESAAASIVVPWSSVERIVETDRAHVVKAGGQVLIFPKQPDPGAVAAFVGEIRSRANLT